LSAISFPGTLARPGTRYSPTCQIEISFNAFRHCHTCPEITCKEV
jgi:hypothetical protein